MSTPNKRRKKNDHPSSSPSTVRSIDFFFAKQQQQPKSDAQFGDQHGLNTRSLSPVAETTMTDEELARKLQAEWNEQDQIQPQDDAGSGKGLGSQEHVKEETTQESALPGNNISPDEAKVGAQESVTSAQSQLPLRKDANIVTTLSLQSATADDDAISYTLPLDESPLTFDPQKYLTELKSQWASQGGSATYALLTHGFVLINATQSRIKIVDTLVNLLRVIIAGDPDSLLPAVWLATNSISPPYIDVELGLGGSAISKALKKVCGLDNAGLKTLYNKHGDAGDVAFEAKKRQSMTLRKPKPLTIRSVFDSLFKIANAKGTGSQEVKQRIVERLLQDARGPEESRYVVRTLVQHLRIGAVKTTMLIALSRAFLLSRPSGVDFPTRNRSDLVKLSKQELAEVYAPAEELVKASFARRPNYNDLVPTLLQIGINEELLIRCGLALHIPLRPMLGGITRDLGEMLTKLQERDFTCEFKYDGQRAQVHCDAQGKVTLFSRHLEVMTEKYPDLVALVPRIRGEGVSSFIMEGEVVAVDRATGNLKPFQVLANRARKDVVIQSVTVDVCLFAFDLMYLNGEELLSRPFRERRNLLRSLFQEIPHHFTWVKSLDATSADGDAISDFFRQATDIKCEGIMVKVLDNANDVESIPPQVDISNGGVESILPAPPSTPSKSKKRNAKAKSKSLAISTSTTAVDDDGSKPSGSRRKALLATYEPDKRLDSWLKVKKDYATHADTIDLIPVGAWHGQGRKNAWWSPILLACRNESTGALEVVTKCISGFTDAFYKANRARYDPDRRNDDGDDDGDDDEKAVNDDGADTPAAHNTLASRPAFVEYAGHPDVWFEPQEVWEMAFADITLSPTYTAAIGLVSDERGLSLRFPRFLRVRNDKSIDEASTSEFLAALYRKQESRPPTDSADADIAGAGTSTTRNGNDDEDDDDLYG